MQRKVRALLVAVAILGLALAGLEIFRARVAGSEALRAGLMGAAAAQLDARLEPGPLALELWPAAVRLTSPRLELANGAHLALPETRVELAPGSLLSGSARVAAVSLAGPARLDLAGVELSGALTATLQLAADAPGWSLEADAELGTGGSLEIAGRLDPTGRFVGEVRLSGVNGAPFSPWLAGEGGAPARLDGSFDGRLDVPGGDDPPTLRVASERAELALPPLVVSGPVAAVAELPTAPGTQRGFAVDASRARVDYAGGSTRASGRGASVEGRIARDTAGQLRLEEVSFRIHGFRAERRPDRGS